jgi:hypothetical protein
MTLSAAWAIWAAGPSVIENIIKLQPTMARTAFMSDNSPYRLGRSSQA